MTSQRDIKDLIEELEDEGWIVTKSKHWKAVHPKGGIVFFTGTRSCPRAILNIRCEIRKVNRRHTA